MFKTSASFAGLPPRALRDWLLNQALLPMVADNARTQWNCSPACSVKVQTMGYGSGLFCEGDNGRQCRSAVGGRVGHVLLATPVSLRPAVQLTHEQASLAHYDLSFIESLSSGWVENVRRAIGGSLDSALAPWQRGKRVGFAATIKPGLIRLKVPSLLLEVFAWGLQELYVTFETPELANLSQSAKGSHFAGPRAFPRLQVARQIRGHALPGAYRCRGEQKAVSSSAWQLPQGHSGQTVRRSFDARAVDAACAALALSVASGNKHQFKALVAALNCMMPDDAGRKEEGPPEEAMLERDHFVWQEYHFLGGAEENLAALQGFEAEYTRRTAATSEGFRDPRLLCAALDLACAYI
ncbi:unnamed protein product, partial [Polarella glacialis]